MSSWKSMMKATISSDRTTPMSSLFLNLVKSGGTCLAPAHPRKIHPQLQRCVSLPFRTQRTPTGSIAPTSRFSLPPPNSSAQRTAKPERRSFAANETIESSFFRRGDATPAPIAFDFLISRLMERQYRFRKSGSEKRWKQSADTVPIDRRARSTSCEDRMPFLRLVQA